MILIRQKDTKDIDVLLQAVNEAVISQAKDGSFKGGNNGPYLDRETSVRNTAHWLTLFSFSNFISDPVINKSAHKAVDYLLSKTARPMSASFHSRCNLEKDLSNGLMGQAWAIEGLISAGEYLNRPDAIEIGSFLNCVGSPSNPMITLPQHYSSRY